MEAILKLINASLPTIPYGHKPEGSRPIEISVDSWQPAPARTPIELAKLAEIRDLCRQAQLHGAEAIEGLTPEMIDLEAELSWRDALDPRIPSREELELMLEQNRQADELTLALRWLDPPQTHKAAS